MSVKIMSAVWEQSQHKGAHLLVLLALADHASDDGVSWPSLARLASCARVAPRHVRRILRDLEAEGEIIVVRGAGRGNTNMYLVTLGLSDTDMVKILTQRLGVDVAEAQRIVRAVLEHREKGDIDVPFSPSKKGDIDVPFSPKKGTHVSEKGDTCVPLNHHEPSLQEEEERGGTETRKTTTITARLRELGIFPEPAEEIAAAMVEAGLTPDEAEEIALKTLRATDGNVGQAVYRLQQRVWDAGEAAARAMAKARYAEYAEAEPPPVPIGEDDQRPEEALWRAVLDELQLETTRATFNTWLRDTRLVACEDGVFVIGVRNGYAKDWLENRLASTIRRILSRHAGREVEVRFVVEEPNAD